MDGGVILADSNRCFVIWPIIKSNRQQKQIEETLSSIPNLTIQVKVEKIKEIQCLVVYAKGWVNSKDHSISGNITLSLIDKTEDPGSIILTTADGLGGSYPHIFGQSREMELGPDIFS